MPGTGLLKRGDSDMLLGRAPAKVNARRMWRHRNLTCDLIGVTIQTAYRLGLGKIRFSAVETTAEERKFAGLSKLCVLTFIRYSAVQMQDCWGLG